jgi:hypothetical protein
MDAVDREDLIGLLVEALIRDVAFRPTAATGPPMRIDAGSRP